jgi:creatinine amidohydrolase
MVDRMMSDPVFSMPTSAGRWWEGMASPELRGDPTTVVLIPVGATEQHGPHLPTGTDTIVATALCALASTMAPAIVAPPIAVGVSSFHGHQLPGTFAVSAFTLVQLMHDYVTWAAANGHTRFLFVNGHVGNGAALSVGTDELRSRRPDLRAGSVDWWTLSPAIAAEVTSDAVDWHANRAETSLMLALAPDLVHLDRLADADDEDRSTDLVFRYSASGLTRTGATGMPSLADGALGEGLLAMCSEALAEVVMAAAVEEPPLGGR